MLGVTVDEEMRRATGEGFFRRPGHDDSIEGTDDESERSRPRVQASHAPSMPSGAPMLVIDGAADIEEQAANAAASAGEGAGDLSSPNSVIASGGMEFRIGISGIDDVDDGYEEPVRRESLTVPKQSWERDVVVASSPKALVVQQPRTSSVGAGGAVARSEIVRATSLGSSGGGERSPMHDDLRAMGASLNTYPHAGPLDPSEQAALIATIRSCLERLERGAGAGAAAAGHHRVPATAVADNTRLACMNAFGSDGDAPPLAPRSKRGSGAAGDMGGNHAFDAVVPAGHRRPRAARSKSLAVSQHQQQSQSQNAPPTPSHAPNPSSSLQQQQQLPANNASITHLPPGMSKVGGGGTATEENTPRNQSVSSIPSGVFHGVDQTVGGGLGAPVGSSESNAAQTNRSPPAMLRSPATSFRRTNTARRVRKHSVSTPISFPAAASGEFPDFDDQNGRPLRKVESASMNRNMGAERTTSADVAVEDLAAVQRTATMRRRKSKAPHGSGTRFDIDGDDTKSAGVALEGSSSSGSLAGSTDDTHDANGRKKRRDDGTKGASKRVGLPDSHRVVQAADLVYVTATYVIYALAIAGLARDDHDSATWFVVPIVGAYAASILWTVLRFFVQIRSGPWDIAGQLTDIRHHYLRSWFALDLFSALPLDFFFLLWSVDVFFWVQVRHVLRIVRIVSLARSANPLRDSRMGIMLYSLALFVVLAVHFFAAGFKYMERDRGMSYFDGLYWTVTTVSSVGYGDVVPAADFENRGFATIVMVFGVMMISVMTALATSAITTRDALDEAVRARKAMLSSMLEYYRIPWQEQIEIIGLFPIALDKENEKGFTNLVENLPGFIVGRIERYTRAKALADAIPLFSELPVDVVLDVTSKLQQHFATANEEIISKGDDGNEMFFLVRGVADVVIPVSDTEDLVVASLRSGAFFGEMALLQNTTRTASVVTVVPCELLVLSKADFQVLVEEYTILEKLFLEVIFARLELTTLTTKEDTTAHADGGAEVAFNDDGGAEGDESDADGDTHFSNPLAAAPSSGEAPGGELDSFLNPAARPNDGVPRADRAVGQGHVQSGRYAGGSGRATTNDSSLRSNSANDHAVPDEGGGRTGGGNGNARPPIPSPATLEPEADQPLTSLF